MFSLFLSNENKEHHCMHHITQHAIIVIIAHKSTFFEYTSQGYRIHMILFNIHQDFSIIRQKIIEYISRFFEYTSRFFEYTSRFYEYTSRL